MLLRPIPPYKTQSTNFRRTLRFSYRNRWLQVFCRIATIKNGFSTTKVHHSRALVLRWNLRFFFRTSCLQNISGRLIRKIFWVLKVLNLTSFAIERLGTKDLSMHWLIVGITHLVALLPFFLMFFRILRNATKF